jgi:hypothetical protein
VILGIIQHIEAITPKDSEKLNSPVSPWEYEHLGDMGVVNIDIRIGRPCPDVHLGVRKMLLDRSDERGGEKGISRFFGGDHEQALRAVIDLPLGYPR